MRVSLTVALRYTLSRFEVVGDSTELSLIQLSSARFNWAQLSSQGPARFNCAQLYSTVLSSIQPSSARFSWAGVVELSWAQLNPAELSWIELSSVESPTTSNLLSVYLRATVLSRPRPNDPSKFLTNVSRILWFTWRWQFWRVLISTSILAYFYSSLVPRPFFF